MATTSPKVVISVLIPWRDDGGERRRLLTWLRSRYAAMLPEGELCCADSLHDPFNRGASVNLAARQASGDVFVVADADTAFDPAAIREAVALAVERNTWVLPYGVYVNLDRVTTERLLAGPPTAEIQADTVTAEHWLADSVSGLVVLSRAGFESMGGYDEGFQGWGYEDRAFAAAADTLLGPVARLPGHCFHLWHTEGQRFAQPHIRDNLRRADRYRAAMGNPEAMRAMVAR